MHTCSPSVGKLIKQRSVKLFRDTMPLSATEMKTEHLKQLLENCGYSLSSFQQSEKISFPHPNGKFVLKNCRLFCCYLVTETTSVVDNHVLITF